MDPKKSTRANLENKRGLFFQIGMAVSLLLMIGVFASSQTEKAIGKPMSEPLPPVVVEEPPITRTPEKVQPAAQLVVVDPQVLNIVPNSTNISVRLEWNEFIEGLPVPEPVQPRTETPTTNGDPFLRVEEMPQFEGGDINDFRRWVQSKISYPSAAAQNGIQGKVTLSFVIETDGTLSSIEVLQSPDRSLSEEAIRILNLSPRWTPGKQRNAAVRVRFNLPLEFKLER